MLRAATLPQQRPPGARLLFVRRDGGLEHLARRDLAALLRPGDLLVANDAATMPASLHGRHDASGAAIEVRLAGRRSIAVDDVQQFTAVLFGAGDHRTRTEDRPLPPVATPGDRLTLGPLHATITRVCGHPRLLELRFDGDADTIWAGIARHGRPVQYAHMAAPLALWDLWTRVAALPVAFEPPSAGFLLDWQLLQTLAARGIGFATLTHAAGLSSTGDDVLDARLPLDEPYHLPASTVAKLEATRRRGGRVIALGTTVTRALEHAASRVAPGRALPIGEAIATQRLGPQSRLCVVDALISGTHEPGSSHHALLRAFTGSGTLARVDAELTRHGYLTHEFGDSVFIEADAGHARPSDIALPNSDMGRSTLSPVS